MRDSLSLYGHRQPTVFYTDNMADKQFLESCFPSLRDGVVDVDKYSHLPPLTIPDDVNICKCAFALTLLTALALLTKTC